MRQKLPTLGEPPPRSPLPKVLALALALGLIAGGIYFFLKSRPSEPLPGAPTTVAETPAPEPAGPPPPTPAKSPLEQAGLERVSITVDGPLETAIVAAVGREVGAPLTQVVTRALVWWLNVPADLRRGDTLDVLYERRAGEEPVVHAVRFKSSKMEKTFQAYRFKAEGDAFARLYEPSGEELERRLVDAPIDTYEQVTSRLKDGRGHKGVDFKTPVGTPVKATFDGTITRKNWNFRCNGNCLELTESGGRRKALFLHLSEIPKATRLGMKVKKGDVIASSGNSGKSYAPHLHYQLMRADDRVIDPFDSHETFKKRLSEAQKAALDAEIRRLDGLWSAAIAGG